MLFRSKKNMNEKEYDIIRERAKKLFLERQEKYGNSVDIIDLHTIVGLMLMKLKRVYDLPETAKIEDELLDCFNYCIFGLDKYKKEVNK